MKTTAFLALSVLFTLLFPFVFMFCLVLTFLPISASRVGIDNLRTQLKASFWQARSILAQVYLQYASYIFELVFMWPLGLIQTTNTAAFAQLLTDLVKKYNLTDNQGVLCLGAHFGNIEGLGLAMQESFLQAKLKPFYVLAKPSRFKWANSLMELVREKRGFLVLWTGRPAFQQELLNTAKTGYGLALLIDQKPAKDGLFVKFFEENAAFPSRGVGIGVDAGMAFVHVTARRISLGKFEMIFEEGWNGHLASSSLNSPVSTDVLFSTSQIVLSYVEWLEGVVRAYPGQWFWDYRKWSRKEKSALKNSDTKIANS